MGPSAPQTSVAERKTILVVDDQDQVRAMLKMAMEALGFAVDVACSGEEALPFLDAGHYDAVICDLMMPTMSGHELFGVCQQRRPEVANRFVFVSGSPNGSADSDTALATGQPHLSKPCRLRDIQAAIVAVGDANPRGVSAIPSRPKTLTA